MAAHEAVLTFEMLICPESNSGSAPVMLWAAEDLRLGQPLYVAPSASWVEYSRRFKKLDLIDDPNLRLADTCVARGEHVALLIHCRPVDLAELGFEETTSPLPLELWPRTSHHSIASLRQLPHRNGEADKSRATTASADWHLPACAEGPVSAPVECTGADDLIEPEPPIKAEPTPSDSNSYGQLPPRRRIAILGVCLDDFSMDETIERIDGFIHEGGFHQIATANVDFLTKALTDRELLTILHGCDLVLADGMPLIWSSRLLGVPLRQRVTGADLLPRLLALSARKKRRIFLLGASEENSRHAAQRIQRDFPEAIICGRLSPPLAPIEEMDHEAILDQINSARPDVLLVAFGNPKQEKWIAMHRDRIQVSVCIGVGASIDFVSGKQKRAPIWMQDAGLEWTFRLASEPRRLALRYLDNALFLLRHLSVQLLTNSLQPRDTQSAQVHLLRRDDVLTASIIGGFSGATVETLMAKLSDSPQDCFLIVDLSSSTFIAPDAAAAIAHVAHQQTRKGRELWVVGDTPVLRKAIKATFPAGEPFRTAPSVQHAVQLRHAEAAQ